jgi:formylglycine-generating enzyme required for sulfatase activity
LGRYEVTQAQWSAVIGSNPSLFQGASYPNSTNRPVENLSWNMVQAFTAATGLRLPTEAEWEYACRAGTVTEFHSFPGYPDGTNTIALVVNIAWLNLNSTPFQTRAVGQKAPNSLGFYDMLGNASEFVQDYWLGTYYQTSPTDNPQGPTSGTLRVMRGGNISQSVYELGRASARYYVAPSSPAGYGGFRVARNP